MPLRELKSVWSVLVGSLVSRPVSLLIVELSLQHGTQRYFCQLGFGCFVGPATRQSTGFVKAEGQGFTLNAKPYTVFGSNSYWVGLAGLTADEMNVAFKDIAATGGTTVRTWSLFPVSLTSRGFNEVTTPTGEYYQLWNGSTPTINSGPTGLGTSVSSTTSSETHESVPMMFIFLPDNVIAAAKANDIRLIVTFTNNWSDYGGMDTYVNQIVGEGQPHDYFYTNPQIMAATYNNWYSTVVDSGLTGVLIWQAGSNLTSGTTPDDGFTIFPGNPVYHMEQGYSAKLKARNGKSQLY
ncbi:glycoside hydrolase family 5 protein [Paxillus involutus ATCC 200175]|uniref:Glycoside hydrolase family 5 protein n=1 Tax=Paxillus involutus ATCC 200175 TaxID=664439 RepID=A0A0C9U473_PAXIN|nr:glycoside hydrolase family 5 protein [Paxillus involutus ATCC 200175]